MAESAAAYVAAAAEAEKKRALMELEIAKAKEEMEAFKKLRKAREARVVPEPAVDGFFVSVRDIDLGVLTRAVPSSATMSAVYDWVESLCPTPKHFRLTKMPNTTLYAEDKVTEANRELLSMLEESVPLPLAPDEVEVTFYEEENDDPFSADTTLMDLSDGPPQVLLEGDVETAKEDQSTLDSFASLEAFRKQ